MPCRRVGQQMAGRKVLMQPILREARPKTWEAALCRLLRLMTVAVAVHLQDMDVVGEPVQQRAGEAFRTEHLGPLIEGQVGGDQDGAALVALAEDLEEEFANMALLDRRACRMVAESGGPGWKQPCLRPRLGIPPCRSSGGGWKTRFISPRQDGILLPIPARGAAG